MSAFVFGFNKFSSHLSLDTSGNLGNTFRHLLDSSETIWDTFESPMGHWDDWNDCGSPNLGLKADRHRNKKVTDWVPCKSQKYSIDIEKSQ